MKRVLIVIAALFIAIALTNCGGPEQRKAAHMERGRALFSEGNYDKARVEFNNVLQIDPKDDDARFLVAQTYEKLQDWRNAAAHYLRVIENNPKHLGARLRMGQVYLLGQAFDKAGEQADEVLRLAPDNADGLALRGSVHAQQGDTPGALDDGSKALRADPGNVNATALVAALYLGSKQLDKATELLKQGLEKHPENAGLRTVLAKVYADSTRNEDAVALLADGVKREPRNLGNRMQLGMFLASLNRLDEAEKVLREGVAALPDSIPAKLGLAEFLATKRDKSKAAAELQKWIQNEPDAYEFRFALATLYEGSADNVRAKGIYEEIIKRNDKGLNAMMARTRLAGVWLREKDEKKAQELIDVVLKDNARDREALTLHGQLAMMRQDYTTAIGDFRTVLKDDPGSTKLQRLLARAHLLNKEIDLAHDTLKKAIDNNPRDLELRGDYLQLLSQVGDLKAVVDQLNEVLKVSPNNFGALETLFKVHAANQDWGSAQQIAEQLKSAYPDKPHGYYFAGLVNQAQRKFEASVEDFEQALRQAPDAAEPLSQLMKSYLALGQKDKAQERLDRIIAEQPKNFVAYNLKGELLLDEKKYDDAAGFLKKSMELNPKWPVPYANLALIYEAQLNTAAAVDAYKTGIAATANSPVLITGLASLLEQTGDYDQAIAQYETALQAAPDAAVAVNNLAMLLVEYRKDAASVERAKKLVEVLKGSNNPAYLDTVGWVMLHAGDLDAAIPSLEQAVKAAPEAAVLRYHLGMAYLKKGDREGARDNLRKAVDSTEAYRGMEDAKAALKELDAG